MIFNKLTMLLIL